MVARLDPSALQRALTLHQQGDLKAAEGLYRQVLAVDPRQADALHLLGLVAFQAGRISEAIGLISQAIKVKPAVAGFHLNLGNAFRRAGRGQEAVAAYLQAIRLQPGYADAYANLGATLMQQGDYAGAIEALRQALRLNPGHADAHANLGAALMQQGDPAGAIEALHQALRLNPGHADAHANLGAALMQQGDLTGAIEALRQALRLNPGHADAYANLGATLKEQGDLTGAIEAFRRAIALRPLHAAAHYNLGNALKDAGRIDEAVAAYRRALEINPEFADARSNLLFALNHSMACDPAAVLAEHRGFDEMLARALSEAARPHDSSPGRPARLKVGYVSPDFRKHPVGYFIAPLLANHNRERFEIWCFHNHSRSDSLSAYLKGHADHWIECAHMTDAALAGYIRDQGIHILVDLAGHTAGNRLPVFARKPAPVQVSYLGYANTSGLSAMDYRITDAVADPVQLADSLSTETLWRVPGSYFCFLAPDEAVDVSPLPASRNGYVTFGYCGSYAKVTPATLALWAGILDRVADSRIVVRSKSLGDQVLARELVEFLGQRGINPNRISTLGWAEHSAYRAGFQDIDIFLDTFPFNLATNTFEALWMGVPVITLAGVAHASRMGASILTALGLEELIASTPDAYVAKCAELAADPIRLAHLRSTLRERLRSSGLMDGGIYARKIETAYDAMWAARVE